MTIKLSTGETTTTDSKGLFEINNMQVGRGVLSITAPHVYGKSMEVAINPDEMVDLGEIAVQLASNQTDIAVVLDEADVSNDEASTQNISSSLAESEDVYFSNYGFKFGAMRFNLRGYSQEHFTTYINGINFNSTERGNFEYSSIGGLNDAVRNRDGANGLSMPTYAFGNLGGVSNIDLRPSRQAIGGKASLAYTNRAYTTRAMATYSTGIRPDGWAFTVSASQRWAKEGIIEGTYYNSWAYLASAEKIINSRHSISISTFGSPTERGTSSASVQEAYDLKGDNLYNPNWGYQDGKKRNARVAKSYEPTLLLSYEWKISDKSTLNAGLAGRISQYKKSGLNWYNANDPRPDYYRYLPSYYNVGDANYAIVKNEWETNSSFSQINWDNLYNTNREKANGRAVYMLEDQNNDFKELTFNATLKSRINDHSSLVWGLEARKYKGSHYKTINDLLDSKYWIDIDQFAERDSQNGIVQDPQSLQNDLNNPNRQVKVGDRFGYDYDLYFTNANTWLQGHYNLSNLELSAAAKYAVNSFYRYGNMRNGRAPDNSYGKGSTHTFGDVAGKLGAIYKLDGRNFIIANASYETRSPLPYNAYVSPRIKDTRIPNIKNGKIISGDLGYTFSYSIIKGRIGGYYTVLKDQIEINNFYHDALQSYVNYILTGLDKEHKGIEFGLSSKVTSQITLEFIGNVGEYKYTNNPTGTTSIENGSKPDNTTEVMFKNYKVNGQPQTALSFSVNYFHPKMWFFETNINYYANNYIDLTPVKKESANIAKFNAQEKFKNSYIWDASLGKLIYLKNRQSININLSVQNILNDKNIKTGGFEQARIDSDGDTNKYPAKYFYLQGFNFFLNIGYKF